jgi:hypothetical protein
MVTHDESVALLIAEPLDRSNFSLAHFSLLVRDIL